MSVAQSCPTLCDPMDYSLPGFPVHGILQARILEWVAVPFSRGSSQPRDWTQVSCIADWFFTNWATREALSMRGLEIPMGLLWLPLHRLQGPPHPRQQFRWHRILCEPPCLPPRMPARPSLTQKHIKSFQCIFLSILLAFSEVLSFPQISQLFRNRVWYIHPQMGSHLSKRHSEKIKCLWRRHLLFHWSQRPPSHLLLETQTGWLAVRDSNQLVELAWTIWQGSLFLNSSFSSLSIFFFFFCRMHSFAFALHTNNWRVGIIQRARVRHPICSFLTAIYNVRL